MSYTADQIKQMKQRADALVEQIRFLLAGAGPEIQGAVLAELVSIWAAGHNPSVREEALQLWIKTLKTLIPASEYEMFGDAGFPEHRQ